MIKQLLSFLIAFICVFYINAQNNNSQQLVRSSTGVSGSSSTVSNNNQKYIIQQSFGQSSAIGTFEQDNYVLRQGFIQPNILSKVIDKNVPLNLNVIVFPNPFVENISLSFNEEIKGEVTVFLYDMLGRMLFTNQYSANKTINVQLSNLPVAHYILKVRSDKKQFIKKIIKK